MTINRLLRLPKSPPIHSFQNGLPNSTRWCSSSPSSGALQKPPNSKQQRALATVEGSDNECVERDWGSFLDPINFQNEVGKSWLTLKGILIDLRAKVIGAPQSRKQNSVKMRSSTGSSAGQLELKRSNGKRVDGGHKDVGRGYKKSLLVNLEGFVNSHINEKRVTETAASNIIRKRSSKDEGQSGLKPESEFGFPSSLTHQLPGDTSRILQKDIGNASTVVGNGNHQPGIKMPSSSGSPQQVRGLADMFMETMNGQRADVIISKKSDTVASNGVLDLSNEANDKHAK